VGVCICGLILSREVDGLFVDIKFKFLISYLLDLLVYSKTLEDHVRHLPEVFSRIQDAGFTLNPVKLVLVVEEVSFSGPVLSVAGIPVNPERVRVIHKFPSPKILKQVRRFLGMNAFYCRLIPNVSRISEPLNSLKCKSATFLWGGEQQKLLMQSRPPFVWLRLFKFQILGESSFCSAMLLISRFRVF
jgi:hypothetical protein